MSNVKIFAKTIEQKAADQVNRLAEHPAFTGAKIRIMPDVHAGAGCVIGFTADLGEKVIPNVVGVDIGCGMLCVKLKNHVSRDDLVKLDALIRRKVPSGFNVHDEPYCAMIAIEEKALFCKDELSNWDHIRRSLGTLGGGNHFIELDKDDDGCAYLVIHTGSRNLGKRIAEIYQRGAIRRLGEIMRLKLQERELIDEYKAQGRQSEIAQAIMSLRSETKAWTDVPNDLAYLTGADRECYLHDMEVCQRFATANREAIANIIMEGMSWEASASFETIHNYIDRESNIVRKGAVSARQGERLIIPMNMRDGSLICVGKGNEDWNCSAPHGAGRLMSRTEARQTLLMEQYKKTMQGVYSTSVTQETIDEAPMAYKPMDEIIACIGDTVRVEKIIKPIYNFKAAEK